MGTAISKTTRTDRAFSQLFRFTDPEFAKNTPVIQFSTLNSFMNWQVFAVFYTDLEFNFINPNPPGGIDQMAATAISKSLYDYGVTVGPGDHVLVLSTCTIKYGRQQYQSSFCDHGKAPARRRGRSRAGAD